MIAVDTSIIVSTYNSPLWLEKVLYGFNNQTYRMFELIVADDGSTSGTLEMIEQVKKNVFYPITHVWHEDQGFQKTKILNKAILKCTTPYILMTDGDCIPRKDFVEQHVKYRVEGRFLSGGYFKLPINISENLTEEDIYRERCFDIFWLKKHGLKSSFKNRKLSSGPIMASLMNYFTPSAASWNGHNSSAWKSDIIAVNGFDERMQYGGEDREMGERLENFGLKGKQIRYSAVTVHLDHPRGYVTHEMLAKNKTIREQTKRMKSVWTDHGIVKSSGTAHVSERVN